MHRTFQSENMKRTEHLGDTSIVGRIMDLKEIACEGVH
jgi:hypothetical protein